MRGSEKKKSRSYVFSKTPLYRKYGTQKKNELDRSWVLMSNMSKGSHLRAKRIYRSPHAADISFRKSEAVLARRIDNGIYAYTWGAVPDFSLDFSSRQDFP